MRMRSVLSLIAVVGLFMPGSLQAGVVTFSVTNDAPANGLWIMRPWVGVSDGGFTTYTIGQRASAAVQHEAEDGVTGDPANTLPPSNACTAGAPGQSGSDCLYQVFKGYANGHSQTTIGNPTKPGVTISGNLAADPANPLSRYLDYLVMAVPSNDTFFGTPTSAPVQLFDASGKFLGTGADDAISIAVYAGKTVLTSADGTTTYDGADGGGLLDAGTELNNECAADPNPSDPASVQFQYTHDTAFLCQPSVGGAGTGVHTGVSNMVEPDTTPFGPNIVNGSNMFPAGTTNIFPNVNDAFANPQDPVATIEITFAPEPASIALLGAGVGMLGLLGFLGRRRG